MAASVRSVLAGLRSPLSPDAAVSAAVQLRAALSSPVPVPTDPAAALALVDEAGAEQRGTWQEVRAARDHGDLPVADYDLLSLAMDELDNYEGTTTDV